MLCNSMIYSTPPIHFPTCRLCDCEALSFRDHACQGQYVMRCSKDNFILSYLRGDSSTVNCDNPSLVEFLHSGVPGVFCSCLLPSNVVYRHQFKMLASGCCIRGLCLHSNGMVASLWKDSSHMGRLSSPLQTKQFPNGKIVVISSGSKV